MEIIKFISNFIVPFIICYIVFTGFKEKKQVFDLFLEGAKEGIEIVIGIFPTLIGIFLAVGMIQSTNFFELIEKMIYPVFMKINMPVEIIPLALVRPLSGSAALGVASDLMVKYGVDSYIGKVASVIMGSTETTLYTIAIYTSCIKVKKCKHLLKVALLADAVGIISSIIFCRIMSNCFC